MKATALLILMIIASACSSSAKVDAVSNPKIEILDESALSVIDPYASIDIIAEGFNWTEGPLWVSEGDYLLFSDIPNNRIHKYSDSEGLSTYLDPAGATGLADGDYVAGSNGLLLNSKGQLVVFQQGDRRVAVMDAPVSAAAS
jgi:gluconolactonase